MTDDPAAPAPERVVGQDVGTEDDVVAPQDVATEDNATEDVSVEDMAAETGAGADPARVCVLPVAPDSGGDAVAGVERAVRELVGDGGAVGLSTIVADLGELDTLSADQISTLIAARRVCRNVGVQLRVAASSASLRRLLVCTDAGWRGLLYPSAAGALPVGGDDSPQVAELRSRLREREEQLASQPVIEQVKGMLMQDFGLDSEEAFQVLKTLSQDSNAKLRDVAAELTARLRGQVTEATAETTLEIMTSLRDQLRAERRPD